MKAQLQGALHSGLGPGVAAYLLWGLFPLYWGYLTPATAWEVLAARVLFALVCLVPLVSGLARWGPVAAVWRDPRRRVLLSGAAVVVSINWGTYIWAVDHGHVVDSSLGYFINPLVSIALGVFVLGERLRPAQWAAVGIAAVAVGWSALLMGRVPWISLILAFSFGFYGLAKKSAGVDPVASLTFELCVLAPLALGFLTLLGARSQLSLFEHGWGHFWLMAGAGPITMLPLLLFGMAARRLPLTTLGLLQYLAPTLNLILGVVVFSEVMTASRGLGFVGIWVAIVVFSLDSLAASRAQPAVVPAQAAN